MISRQQLIVLSIVFIMLGTGVSTVGAASQISTDSNDSIGTATPIEPGEYTDLQLEPDGNNYYSIELKRGETINVVASFQKEPDGDNPEINPNLYLKDADGNNLDFDQSFTTPTSDVVDYRLSYEAETTQTVYIHAESLSSTADAASYSLLVERAANDRFEPNGELGQAPTLEPGTYENLSLLAEEDDYYAVKLEAGETVNVTTTFQKQSDGEIADNDPTLELVDSSGNNLDYSQTQTTPASDTVRLRTSYEAEETQTVYILVEGISDIKIAADYSLTIERAANDRFEPNGELSQAPVLEPGTYDDLSLLAEEDDYYAVELNAGETVNLTTTFQKQSDGEIADNDPTLELVDSSGNNLDYSQTQTTPESNTIRLRTSYEAEETQTVYILVEGISDIEVAADYSLTIERAENDGFEPNGELSQASVLEPGTYENLSLLAEEDDYYAVELKAGETVNVTTTFQKQSDGEISDNDPDLELVDSSGNNLDYSQTQTTPVSDTVRLRTSYEAEKTQTVYVLVEGVSDIEVAASYSLTVERAENDRFEPNGIPAQATEIEPGVHENLSLLASENDYYRIDLSQGQTLNTRATFNKQSDNEIADNNPRISLVTAEGEFLEGGTTNTTPTRSTIDLELSYEAERDQTVFIRVEGLSDVETSSSYTLQADGFENRLTIDGTPVSDLDNDGVYEDINGDGEYTISDVQAFFVNVDSDDVQQNPDAFDFNGDSSVTISDVQALFSQLNR